MCAFDISRHFQTSWQNTGFKAQLVVDSKATALKYHESLNDIGAVSSEVVISPPDTREGARGSRRGDDERGEQVLGQNDGPLWLRGSIQQANHRSVQELGQAGNPDRRDKLITGFDAPRNTVLYLCRKLREHTLLQAIARVNRLHEGKEFGYIIDYANVLG